MDDFGHGLFEWLWALVLTAVGLVWRNHRVEIKEIKSDVQRLYNSDSKQRDDLHKTLSDIKDLVHEGHVAILKELAKKADK